MTFVVSNKIPEYTNLNVFFLLCTTTNDIFYKNRQVITVVVVILLLLLIIIIFFFRNEIQLVMYNKYNITFETQLSGLNRNFFFQVNISKQLKKLKILIRFLNV